MRHSDFAIGSVFFCGGREWRCTDIGSRVIVAIRIDSVDVVTTSPSSGAEMKRRSLSRLEVENEGWFKGPPFAIAESVFDEHDQEGCSVDAEG